MLRSALRLMARPRENLNNTSSQPGAAGGQKWPESESERKMAELPQKAEQEE